MTKTEELFVVSTQRCSFFFHFMLTNFGLTLLRSQTEVKNLNEEIKLLHSFGKFQVTSVFEELPDGKPLQWRIQSISHFRSNLAVMRNSPFSDGTASQLLLNI